MENISLHGAWNYRIDQYDIGIQKKWYQEKFCSKNFNIPGTTNSNQVGDILDDNGQFFTKDSVAGLRESFSYSGVLWLQKEIRLPDKFQKKSLQLFIERTLGSSMVWIDSHFFGEIYSLSTPHIHKLGLIRNQENGQFTVTIRLDNRDKMNIGERASAFSNDTQGFWNGIIGDFYFMKENFEDRVVDLRFIEKNSVLVIDIQNNHKISEILDIAIRDKYRNRIGYSVIKKYDYTSKSTLWLKLMKSEVWTEFTPNYYDINVLFREGQIKKRIGLVDLEIKNNRIYNHGKKIFLRGNLDCGVFPETGYPSMDEKDWEKILLNVKRFGFNHVRYHSWCPPEVAFRVADRLGIYLMIEGPFWLDSWFDNSVGDFAEHYSFIKDECLAIIREYGHHPSFCFFAIGNELAGDFAFLASILKNNLFKSHQILTTITANTTNLKREFYEDADDFYVGVEHCQKGLRGNRFLDEIVMTTNFNYDENALVVPKPIITHEIGQYASFPSLKEISKFNGYMIPINLISIQNELKRKDLLDRNEEYTYYSGMLAKECYKAEIEAAVRTNNFSGFQLLGLQDYPGQNTAAIGMVDSHWEEKGFCSSDEFCEFNQEIIPIVELKKKSFCINEILEYTIGVRNSLPFDITKDTEFSYTLSLGENLVANKRSIAEIETGAYKLVEQGYINLSSFYKHGNIEVCLDLIIEIKGRTYRNQWSIWIFSKNEEIILRENLIVEDDWLSPTIEEALKNGKNCIVSLNPAKHSDIFPGNYFPVFWSPVFFESKDSCGMIIDDTHPLFNYFPTNKYLSTQWKNLLENSICFPAHVEKGVTELIPNFFVNERRANIEEYKIKNGNLFIHGFNLENCDSIEERAFRNAIKKYVSSNEFNPIEKRSFTEVQEMFPILSNTITSDKDIAYRCKAWSDNEKSKRMGADKANDGNPFTYWSTAAQTDNHWWCIDFGSAKDISQLIIEPLNYENVDFSILLSNDGENWRNAGKSGSRSQKHKLKVQYHTRYLKLVFHHPINISPGLRNFQALL
ncbi:discoidin domain-containing protein [Enterococcus sp. JM9B]|uniref:discoidin domain-containing protein n=1 Tax=Enterococcus sp. JM9B TaxID=1857216 RepID=UPI001375243F|nr:discoidin domain-containing protein [Enterococcus sp. JM9B]KAF1301881.1 hypothetical protein BAU16_08330 [Enterococcus sp. JM9B]